MTLMRVTHRWGGAVLALLLAILGASGVGLAFRPEIIASSAPAARAPAPDPASYAAAIERFELANGPVRYVRFGMLDTGVHYAQQANGAKVYIDGEGVLASRWQGRSLEEIFGALHDLFFLEPVLIRPSGIVGLLAIVATIFGVVLWLPAARSFKLSAAPAGLSPRALLVYHRNWGIVLALPILFQAATGVLMTFGGALRSSPPEAAAFEPEPTGFHRSPADWARVLSAASAALPGMTPRSVQAPGEQSNVYAVAMRRSADSHAAGSSRVLVEGATGRVLAVHDATRDGPFGAAMDVMQSLHGGAYGGLFGRILTALFGLGLVVISAVGLVGFLKRELKLRRAKAAAS